MTDFDAALDDLYATFTPEDMLTLFSRLQARVASAQYQRLLVLPAEGNDVTALQCPHCSKTLANADSAFVALDVVDVAWRTTTADAADFDLRELDVWYDQGGEFDGLVYLCGECGEPVRLPEGWREV